MFEPTKDPRVFAVPLGVDFPQALVRGLLDRNATQAPEALAQVQLIVNTRRMARRIRGLFDQEPACLLPRIGLITDPGEAWNFDDIPEPVPPLRRRLELVRLISALLDQRPDLAPRSSIYGLADSLAALMDEMHGQGVSPDSIDTLDITDQSGHWAQIKSFVGIVQRYFTDSRTAPDVETRQRLVIERLIAQWQDAPPTHPIILAGSTGSRGTTQLLMRAIAELPQGAIILPGFDREMPEQTWDALSVSSDNARMPLEDHPQYRFADLMKKLEISDSQVEDWTNDRPLNPPRNHLISLALRPAPVTDQWLSDGPKLRELRTATQDLTLVEAPSVRKEALAIAMRLRQAAQEGQTAAFITPDRTLSRQVSAALQRWRIQPDDSAGTPLHLSPAGRFLRHVGDLLHRPLTADALLTLLKHPLTHSGAERGPHLRLSRELELHLRRHGPPYPKAEDIRNWAASVRDSFAPDWAAWISTFIPDAVAATLKDVSTHIAHHVALAERIAKGATGIGSGALWQGDAGRECQKTVSELEENAPYGGEMEAYDYTALFYSVLSAVQVRNANEPHPSILIWGTLEARVQGADLIILGGLNEGSWPETPAADPWLNRSLRRQIGLLLPERRIGLSAHDFQQAILAREVWLTRAIRSDDAETVPSRWLNRLQNLLSGLPEQGGTTALAEMRKRGDEWLQMVNQLESVTPVAPALRPAPMPPVAARPRQLPVTQIKTLIRDPYAIYARHVLGVRKLDSLMKTPDALLRGIVLHKALENFVRDSRDDPTLVTREALLTAVSDILEKDVPWSEARHMWRARMERVADRFVEAELRRREFATPTLLEARGQTKLLDPEFTLTAEADRIDAADDGTLLIYDYKTGQVPSKSVQSFFDKQLLLETVIATRSGFGDLPPSPVSRAVFIGLGSGKPEEEAPLDTEPPEKVWAEFQALIQAYLALETGFTSRRALQKVSDIGDYDQLARFGEWDITDDPNPEELV